MNIALFFFCVLLVMWFG